jgi:GR25 family glycosyltransferase involved in LPS biosynthesis
MDCIYINLAARPDRREALERNFESVKAPGWALHRLEAISAADVERMQTPGSVRPAEKACFLSHREAVRRALAFEGPVMVLEDDVLFGALSCRAVDIALGAHDQASWDVVFTDAGIGNLDAWPHLIQKRRAFERTRDLQLLSVADLQFGGAIAYILNPRSKTLLLQLLDGVDSIDLPYDTLLRLLFQQFQVRAFVVYPFPTTTCDLGELSSIQLQQTAALDKVFSLFRRMTWIGRDLHGLAGEVEALGAASADPEARLFGILFQALAAERLRESAATQADG